MDSPLPQATLSERFLQVFFPETCIHCHDNNADQGLFCGPCAALPFGINSSDVPLTACYSLKSPFVYASTARSLLKAAKFAERRRALALWIQLAQTELRKLVNADTQVLLVPSRRPFLKRLTSAIVPRAQIITDAYAFHRAGGSANKALGEAARFRRIHDTLTWRANAKITASSIIICDDVCTTGATLTHAAYLAEKNLGLKQEQVTIWSLLHRPREFSAN